MTADKIHNFDELRELVTWGMTHSTQVLYKKLYGYWQTYAQKHDINPLRPTLENVQDFLAQYEGNTKNRLKGLLVEAFWDLARHEKNEELLDFAKAIRGERKKNLTR